MMMDPEEMATQQALSEEPEGGESEGPLSPEDLMALAQSVGASDPELGALITQLAQQRASGGEGGGPVQ